MRNILYISYDGLTDALGQSQILSYLKRLAGMGNKIVILSFEKQALFQKEGDTIKKIIDAHGLIWHPLMYTKTPPVLSTIYDVNKGLRISKDLHNQYHFDIVHCRGYISAIIGRNLQKKYGLKFIFDMRGWWPDEKLESGFWSSFMYQPVYRYFKRLERNFFYYCDFAVSLTYKGKEEIQKQRLADAGKIGVIPTCVDFDIFKHSTPEFRLRIRKKLGISEDEKVFVYSGSLGGNYDPQTLIDVFLSFQQIYPESFLLILSKDLISLDIREMFTNAGITRMTIYNAAFTEVSDYLRSADIGFIYYKMSFSTIGRSPTKLGEYWASGIPVIAFKGIGDMDLILERYPGSGVLLSNDKNKWEEEIKSLVCTDAAVLRNYALDYFHIEKGVKFYQQTYELLAPENKPANILSVKPINKN